MTVDLKKTKRFGVALDVTLKVIKQDLIRRFRENNIELTPEQWAVLSEVAENESIYQRELANSTFKDAPTVSRIIDLLCKRGLINRNPDSEDRRRFLISMTKEGREVYSQTAPIMYEARMSGWNGLTDKDFNDLNRILNKISSNISATEQS